MGILRFAWNMYELSKENDRIIEHLDMALEDGEQGKELRHSCSSPLAGWLILLDNDWERCEMDGVRVVLNRLPGATDEPLGIDHVCPGRHIVRTTLSSGVATLDTLLYPGDMLAFRLDEERAAWEAVDDEERALLVEAINQGQIDFYDYFERVATPRLAAGLARPREESLGAVGRGVMALIARLDGGEEPSRLAPDVHRFAAALLGLPIPSFDPIAKPIATMAWERASAGRRDLAEFITHLGLALLPGEPSLLACLARLAAEDGRWDEALALAAQARTHADPALRAWLDALRPKAPYR